MCDVSGVAEETVSGLDKYLQANDETKESKTTPNTVKDPKESLVFTPDMPMELRGGYFTSIGYDGDKRAAYIKLYDAKTHRVHFWYDDTGHKPYCLSDQPVEKLQQNDAIVKNPGFDRFAAVSKHDGLNETEANMTMIIAKDPLSIGGRATGSIRDVVRAWEADIKYVENYIYDKDLKPGMPYDIQDGKLSPTPIKLSDEVSSSIPKFFEGESLDYKELALEWTNLLECPVPDIRKAALDIEVYSPVATRIPDPGTAEHPVICA